MTFNLRHFSPPQLGSTGVEAVHPDEFLLEILWLAPETVLQKLNEQAENRHRTERQLMEILYRTVPRFVRSWPRGISYGRDRGSALHKSNSISDPQKC